MGSARLTLRRAEHVREANIVSSTQIDHTSSRTQHKTPPRTLEMNRFADVYNAAAICCMLSHNNNIHDENMVYRGMSECRSRDVRLDTGFGEATSWEGRHEEA